jgi:TATA-binding protein-associated factor
LGEFPLLSLLWLLLSQCRLGDNDDDVRSVAASCLVPIAAEIVSRLPDAVPGVLEVLWKSLQEMKDDLGSSVGAVMDLLGAYPRIHIRSSLTYTFAGTLVSLPSVIAILSDPERSHPLSELAPTLFPFFRHTIPAVRLAVVHTLQTFLASCGKVGAVKDEQGEQIPSLARDWITRPVFELLFQNLVLEERDDIRKATAQVWDVAIAQAGHLQPQSPVPEAEAEAEPTGLAPLLQEVVYNWLCMLATPIGEALNSTYFFYPTQRGEEAHNVDKSAMQQDLSLIGLEVVYRGRLEAARAMGVLIAAWPAEVRVYGLGS